jgi:glutamyl-tRNA synthetase
VKEFIFVVHMLTRIAPTPSGFLHTGNLYNFLLNWLWARSNGGRVLLRIDDGDADRKRREYVEDIFRVLEWLGLDWDLGPSGPDDFERNWTQAGRTPLYRAMLDELIANNLLFACRCSRKLKRSDSGAHACRCAADAYPLNGPEMAWRMMMTGEAQISFHDRAMGAVSINLADTAGAFVVRRKDGLAAYQICSLADDRHFGITHIARGSDLLESTAMQLHIDRQLNVPVFHNTVFHHHALLLGSGGEKISKSAGKQSESIRESNVRKDIIRSFGVWLGLTEPLPDKIRALVGPAGEFFSP